MLWLMFHSFSRFASSAKSIKNKPIVNEVISDAALLKRYAKEIKALKQSLAKERSTDKAQEVEQVREMLDEQARRNKDLADKVTELKAMLVVSSLPRQTPNDKKKKARRETWAAPAGRRTMRMSMAPVRVEPIELDHPFLLPAVPRWAGLPKISETTSPSSSVESSEMSDEFREGNTPDLSMAEESMCKRLEAFDTPEFKSYRKRRVAFILPPSGAVDAESQTEDFFPAPNQLLKIKASDEVPLMNVSGTPGTPKTVLRLRNQDLSKKLEQNEQFVNTYKQFLNTAEAEVEELREFQVHELRFLEESFEKKIQNASASSKVEALEKDVNYMRQSLSDSEALLLDSNRSLAMRSQEVVNLQERLQKATEENTTLHGCKEELDILREEHAILKKSMVEKDERLSQLENDRSDFDMLMEIALNKYKIKETELKGSLEDAWQEIAAYEGSNMEAVKERSQRVSVLEKELADLQNIIADTKTKESSREVKYESDDLNCKQEDLSKELQMQVEALRKDLEDQVSHSKTLESELCAAQDKVKVLTEDNLLLHNTADALQGRLDEKETMKMSDQTQELDEENGNNKIQEATTTGMTSFLLQPPPSHLDKTFEMSRKLSETIQVLEESILLPTTPRKSSQNSDDDIFITYDLESIKQQLLLLQDALVQQHSSESRLAQWQQEASQIQSLYCQVVADYETEVAVWKTTEAVAYDYVCLEEHPNFNMNSDESQSSSPSSDQCCRCRFRSVTETEGDITGTEDTFYQDISLERSYLFKSFNQGNGGLSLAAELQQAKLEQSSIYEDRKTSVAHSECSSQNVLHLKQIIAALTDEKEELQHLVEQLKLKLQQPVLSENVEIDHLVSTGKTNLSEEESKTGSEFNKSGENANDFHSHSESVSVDDDPTDARLAYSKPDLSRKDDESKDSKFALETQIQSLKEELSDARIDAETLHSYRWEIDSLKSEKKDLEKEIKKLEEELSDARIDKEALCSYRWEIDSLKLEKTDLKKEIQYYEETLDKLVDCSVVEIENSDRNSSESLNDQLKVKSESLKDTNFSKLLKQLMIEKEEVMNELLMLKESKKPMKNDEAKESSSIVHSDIENETVTVSVQVKECTKDASTPETETVSSNFETIDFSVKDLKEQLNCKTNELEEIRELVASLPKGSCQDVDECMNTKDIILNLKEFKQSYDINIKKLADASHQISAFQETEASLSQTRKANEKSVTNELQLTKREIELSQMKMKMLEEENEKKVSQLKNQIEKVVSDKDAELELMILNFSDKEELLEEKIKHLEELSSDAAELKQEISTKDLEIESLRKESLDMEERLHTLEASSTKTKGECMELEVKCDMLEKELSEVRINSENASQHSKKNAAKYEEELANQMTRIEEVSEALEEQKSLLKITEEEKKNLRDMYEALLDQQRQMSEVSMKGASNTQEWQSIMDKTTEEMEQIQKKCSELNLENEQHKNDLDNLKMNLIKKEETLQIKIDEVNQELCSVLETVSKRDEEISKLEIVKNEQSKEICEIMKAVDDTTHQVKLLKGQLEEAQLSLTSKEVECQELAASLKEIQTEKDELSILYNGVCDEKLHMLEKIKHKDEAELNLANEISTMKSLMENLEEESRCLKESNVESQAKIVSKDDIIANLELAQEKLQENLAALKLQERELRENQECSDQQLDKLVRIIERYEREVPEKDEEILHLQRELERKLAKLVTVEESEASLRQQNEDVEQRLKDLENIKQEHYDLLEELQISKRRSTELESLPQKLAEAESLILTLKSDLAMEAEEHRRKMIALESDLDSLRAKLTSSNEELEVYKCKLTKQDSELQEKLSLEMEMMSECDDLKSQVKNFELELETIKMDTENLRTKLCQREEAISLLESNTQKLKEDISHLNKQKSNLEAQQEANDQQAENLMKIIEKFETEMSEKDEQLNKEAEAHNASVAQKIQEIEMLKLEVDDKASAISKSDEARSILQLKNEELLKKLDELTDVQGKCNGLESDLLKYKNQCDELIKLPEKLATAEKTVASLQSDLDILSRDHEQEVTGKEYHATKLKKIEEEFKNLQSELCKVKETLEDKLKSLQMKNEECLRLNTEMEDMVKHYDKEKESRREEFQALQQVNNELQEQLVQAKAKLEESESKTVSDDSTVKMEIDGLNKTLQVLREELTIKTKELDVKQEQCDELNKEMDDMVKHYDEKSVAHSDIYKSLRGQMENTERELSETKTKFLELTATSTSVLESSQMSKDSNSVLNQLREELALKEEKLAIKERECLELNKEMDDIVKHYDKEHENHINMYKSLRQQMESTQKELSETKAKLLEMSATSNSAMEVSQMEKDLNKTVLRLKEELNVKNERLAAKEEECIKLDQEMDDMVNHYNKEFESRSDEYRFLRETNIKLEAELSETKIKMEESGVLNTPGIINMETTNLNRSLAQIREELTVKDEELLAKQQECIQLRQKLERAEKNLSETGRKYSALSVTPPTVLDISSVAKGRQKVENIGVIEEKEHCSGCRQMKERITDLEFCKNRLEEEVRNDNYHEKLEEFEKFKEMYLKERGALESQIEKFKQKIDSLTQSSGNQTLTFGTNTDSLQKSDQGMIAKCKQKLECTYKCHNCENLYSHVKKMESLLDNQKTDYEQKLSNLNSRLDEVNSMSNGLSVSHKSHSGKNVEIATLTEENYSLILKSQESLQESNLVSTNEDMSELKYMKEKVESLQRERDSLNEQLKDFAAIQGKHEESIEAGADKELNQLRRRINELKKENQALKTSKINIETPCGDVDAGDLQDRLIATERQNNELRFRLRALDAPAQKEVIALKEELQMSNQKVKHLREELRRLQNTKSLDATICEMRPPTYPKHGAATNQDQTNSDVDYYSCQSGVVLDVQVMGLKNMVYHLEKEKKHLQNECKTFEQHIEHYKLKAQEWKENATREKKRGEKLQKEWQQIHAEVRKQKAREEEVNSQVECQKFELGRQREVIEKLEQEKKELTEKFSDSKAAASSYRRKTIAGSDTKMSIAEGSEEVSNCEEEQKKTTIPQGGAQHLMTHNAPAKPQTRIERLPWAKANADTGKTSDTGVRLWQSLNKENKDYSKYYLPRESSKPKDEDCKTQ